MKRDPNQVTNLGPQVLGGVGSNDPIAEKYRRDMEERQRTRTPLGGESPPIPRLDQPSVEGMTMADQARMQRLPPPGPAIQHASSIIQPSAALNQPAVQQPQARPAAPQGPALLPQDILPEAARHDPTFREGQGSGYAMNQPHLAAKYGVLRNGKMISPQQLTGGGPSNPGGLKAETVRGLEAVAAFQQQRQIEEGSDRQAEAASAASPAGSAARLGSSDPEGGEKPISPDDRQKVKKAIEGMDDFDFHTFREMMMKDILNNEEQRKIIEARLEPMDVTDYIMSGFVRQRVKINSKLEYTFQSVDGETDLALKRLIVKEATGFNVDDRYILDKYSIMAMACGLYAINKVVLPDYRDEAGNFSDKNFWEKFNKVAKLGFHILASVGVNYFWFDVRVRKLVVADALGNG